MDEAMIRRLRALEDQLDRLQRAEIPAQVVARYTTAAAQSIANATTTTVNFDTLDDDAAVLVTTGAAWVFTAPVSGRYHIDAMATFAASTTWALGSTSGRLSWVVNGSLKSYLDWQDHKVAGTSMIMCLHGSDTAYLTAGQTIAVQVRQNQAPVAALTLINDALRNYVAIALVG